MARLENVRLAKRARSPGPKGNTTLFAETMEQESIQGKTAWEVVERSVDSNSPRLGKVPDMDREYQRVLAHLPARRLLINNPLAYHKRPRKPYRITQCNELEVALVYVAGERQNDPCESCRRGNGPLDGCVIPSISSGLPRTCGNCSYHSNHKCSFARTPPKDTSGEHEEERFISHPAVDSTSGGHDNAIPSPRLDEQAPLQAVDHANQDMPVFTIPTGSVIQSLQGSNLLEEQRPADEGRECGDEETGDGDDYPRGDMAEALGPEHTSSVASSTDLSVPPSPESYFEPQLSREMYPSMEPHSITEPGLKTEPTAESVDLRSPDTVNNTEITPDEPASKTISHAGGSPVVLVKLDQLKQMTAAEVAQVKMEMAIWEAAFCVVDAEQEKVDVSGVARVRESVDARLRGVEEGDVMDVDGY